MSDTPAWKKALQEPNAAAWIGLFVLVVAIGVWALASGGPEDDSAGAHSVVTQAVD